MEGKDNQNKNEQKVDERACHPIRNKSNHPKSNQNCRNCQQHGGRCLSGESLNATRISGKAQSPKSRKRTVSTDGLTLSLPLNPIKPTSLSSFLFRAAQLLLVPYKNLSRGTVQKGTVRRSVIRLAMAGNGIARREDNPLRRPNSSETPLIAPPISHERLVQTRNNSDCRDVANRSFRGKTVIRLAPAKKLQYAD